MPLGSHGEANTGRANEPRNERFDSDQPFDDDPSLSLQGATGTFTFLNPTSAQYSWSGWNSSHKPKTSHHHPTTPEARHANDQVPFDEHQQRPSVEDEGEPGGQLPARRKDDVLAFLWRSRDNRKGRHALLLRRAQDGQKYPHGTLEPTNTLRVTLRGIYALFTRFQYWNISWCVAVVYTLGSVVWVVNGFTGVLPLVGKGSSDALQPISTWTAFAGSSIFFLGSYLLFLEAVNANRSGCFGWVVERALTGIGLKASVHPGDCEHHYHKRQQSNPGLREEESVDDDALNARAEDDRYDEGIELEQHDPSNQGSRPTVQHNKSDYDSSHQWLWWPPWREFRTKLLYELGFLACAIQLVSGFLFWVCKFTTLPGITEYVSQPVVDGTNWAPQIVGCIGFVSASLLFMLETQHKWYIPAPNVLGWHVGFLKLVGCGGFLLSAVFGPLGEHGMQFAEQQSTISSFWGSWAILLGSLVQWYESLDKYPVIQEGTSPYSEWSEDFIEGSKERRRKA